MAPDYPAAMHVVQLNEVVRSSARIMEAAADFRSNGLKERPKSHHQSEGVPLKSILFDLADATYVWRRLSRRFSITSSLPSRGSDLTTVSQSSSTAVFIIRTSKRS